MDVELYADVGLRGFGETRLAPLNLDAGSVGATSEWAGSYHILSMGRHYDDYVVTGAQLSLPPIPGFPAAHPYERLAGKIRATGVTGNIGEAIAAIFARRVMHAQIPDIAHIRPRQAFRRRKAPDYLMRLGALMPGAFTQATLRLPGWSGLSWPEWWPAESKARTTRSAANTARGDALRQLIEYWTLIAHGQPTSVGFGLIVTFTYRPPREVRATLLIPKAPAQLVKALLQKPMDEDREQKVRRCLHAC